MPNYYLSLYNGTAVRPDRVAQLRLDDRSVVFKMTDTTEIVDEYPKAVYAKQAYAVFLAQLNAYLTAMVPGGGGTGTDPVLLAIIPPSFDENAPLQTGGQTVNVVGMNFPAGSYVDIEGSGLPQLTFQGTTIISQVYSGASIAAGGPYDVVLYNSGGVVLARLELAFTVTAARNGLVIYDVGDATNKTITAISGIVQAV